ncbi:M3 family metallopeptidase [Aureitalea marina]|uniref:oligopeptidase A n=1 Tax=Aureitalea marina TaxID=930804 RepID=A0A2S7KQQ9_9FLAO|nr:M3 family metallopeptidase [Aureitalea marina]PQB04969.1 peptidase M3 [Aureitalea marina]
MTNTNPLLQDFDTLPFDRIKNEHFLPAIKTLIKETNKEIDRITDNPETPDFSNTIEALERTGEKLNIVSGTFFNLNSAETNEELQALAQEISPILTEFRNDFMLNQPLFQRVKNVYQKREELDLNPEEQMLLDTQYQAFARNGANLQDEKKTRLREIDTRLAKLSLSFGENVLAETNKYELHLTDEKQLEGLPESAREAAALTATEKEKDGWIFTLDYPSYLPFMTYADSRELRQELAIANATKGCHGDELDNQEIVKEIAGLRLERAQLLGFQTHADYVLERRMAKSADTVNSFLDELCQKARPAAEKEFAQLGQFSRELNGPEQLEIWDGAYYSEKLKQKLFDLDDEMLKPYFPLEQVINGVFEIAGRLYDLSFEEVDDIAVYHPDVKTYRVSTSDGRLNSIFYADFFPRAGKRGGAWMTSYSPQQIVNGINSRPHISIVCNFTKPTPDKPSLLTFNEVTTLFHEFGHALHGMLANTKYSGLSGTNVYWDFVELPSQILENWCYEKEALLLFGRHYQTGEPIPMEYIEKIKASANFMEGMQTLRQLSFGMLDMAWHHAFAGEIDSVKAFESEAMNSTRLYPDVAESCRSTAFSHIFQGGYSAGYYSYKWAEVLDADAFEYFKEEGIFNKKVAQRFNDHILSKGGTEDPMELYIRFRGHKPDPEALLRRAGLIAAS